MEITHNRVNPLLDSIREIIFGLGDGLVSTLGVVVGVAAGTNDSRIVIITGLVLIVVEALSMAAGSYLSSKSHRQLLQRKIREEEFEIENSPEEEKLELIEMYRQRGFTEAEVKIVVNRITKDKKLWLEEMIAKELKIGNAQMDEEGGSAFFMGIAYIAGGMVPVAPFFFLPLMMASIISVVSTILALFLVGYWKGYVTHQNRIRSGLEMMLISMAAASLGYIIGYISGKFFGVNVLN